MVGRFEDVEGIKRYSKATPIFLIIGKLESRFWHPPSKNKKSAFLK